MLGPAGLRTRPGHSIILSTVGTPATFAAVFSLLRLYFRVI